jgi:hypothetical protein
MNGISSVSLLVETLAVEGVFVTDEGSEEEGRRHSKEDQP